MNNDTYSLSGYGSMIADRVRIGAFVAALRATIRPGSVVMDIGTGPGIMAVLACQLGAKCVYAIEPSGVIEVAREIAAVNRCADKITFLEDISTNVTIRVPADVIVSDLRGVLPLYERHIPSIVDARRRLLAPGGTLIARRDPIWAAVVESSKDYGNIVDPWERNTLGQTLAIAQKKVLNQYYKIRVKPGQLLTQPQLWAELDYATIEEPDVCRTLHWIVQRSGTGHGILVWFDMELADGIVFSNSPVAPEAVYGAAFFPWLEPVPLTMGQNVRVEMEAKLLENDYFWRWSTQVDSAEKAGEIVAQFEQSQLHGAVLSPAKLHRSASDYVPQLSDEGRMRRRVLQLIDGQTSLETIATRLAGEFPQRFSHWHKALPYAATISEEFGR